MKKYKIVLTTGLLGILLLVLSCSEDNLVPRYEGSYTEENYFSNEEQCYAALISVYDILRKNSGGFDNMVIFFNAGSDDFYAGGGSPTDGVGVHSFDNFSIDPLTVPTSFMGDYYRGVARANILIQKLPDADMDDAVRARFLAEARALRAFYYFQLVTMFRNIPLITTPVPTSELFSVPQATPAEVYAFIESELLESIDAVPGVLSSAESGRLSQAAVKAILGKAYLYDQKWAEAAAQFADVNGTPGGTSQYGNHLLTSFADLWEVENKFNAESILECSHTNLSLAGWGNWGSGSDEGNSMNQMVGPRGYQQLTSNAPAYISGWSFNPVHPNLAAAMQGDPRFDETIVDMNALQASGDADYAADQGDQNTGYFLKKFMPLTSESSTLGGNTELNYRQNTYIIRLADTYLMEAEALLHTGNTVRAQALLDAVRTRAGVAMVPVTEASIANERRIELAGEGYRFFDLVRTGQTSALTPFGFTPNKNEILPIPNGDIVNTALQQNPGYN